MKERFDFAKWEKRIVSIVLWPIGLTVLFLLQQSVFMTTADTHNIDTGRTKGFLIADTPWMHLAVGLVLALLAWLWARRRAHTAAPVQQRRARAFACAGAAAAVLAAALGVWLVLGLRQQPYGDALEIWKSAQQICAGDLSTLKTRGYIFLYPNQNILLLCEMAVWRLCGTNGVPVLQLVNVAALLVTFFAVGAAAVRMLGADGPVHAAVYAGLLAAFLPLTFYVTFMYAVLPGLAFGALALYFLVRYEQAPRWRWGLPCGICAALAALLKQNFLIFAIAAFLYLAWNALRRKDWRPLVIIALTLVLYAGGERAAKWALYTRNGLAVAPGKPTSTWVLMGLQDLGAQEGWFNKENLDLEDMYAYNSHEAADALAKQIIGERLDTFRSDPAYAVRFFARKTASQWNMPTYQSLYVNQNRDLVPGGVFWADALFSPRGRLYPLFFRFYDLLLTQLWAGVLLYLILRRRQLRLQQLVYAAVFFGGFLFHLVWEVKAQYALPYVVLLLPLALAGWRALGEWLAQRPAAGAKAALRDRGLWLLCGAAALLVLSGASGQYLSDSAAGARAERAAYEEWLTRQRSDAVPDGAYYLRLAGNGSFLWADTAQMGGHAALGDAWPVSFASLYGQLLLDDEDRLGCTWLYAADPAGRLVGLGMSSYDGAYFLTGKDLVDPTDPAQQWYIRPADGGWSVIDRLYDETELYLSADPDTDAVYLAPAGETPWQTWEILPAG